MAEYKGIHGTKIQNYTSDPTNPILGQVWYNETSQTMKFQSVTTAGSWATGGNLNTARWFASNGSGTQTAGLIFGGFKAPPPAGIMTGETESYNGSAWTEVNDLNTARNAMAAGGTQTSALAAAGDTLGSPTTAAESWNGTSWTNVSSLNTARRYLGGGMESGTAGVAFGGLTPPGSALGETELYNGTSWTEVADLNTARRSLAGVGTSTAGLAMGGYVTATVANTETWNGTSWTEVADQNSAGGGAGFGTQDSALKSQGTTSTEIWNGTSWSPDTVTNTNLSNRGGIGTTSLGLLAGGEPPNVGNTSTEEWTGAGSPTTRTITSS